MDTGTRGHGDTDGVALGLALTLGVWEMLGAGVEDAVIVLCGRACGMGGG
jgi:hypothetical protein